MHSRLSIRALKANLSHHVRRAERGTRVVITDRGRPVAVLAPVEQAASTEWAQRAAASGKVTWSGGKPTGLATGVPGRGSLISQDVLEDRRVGAKRLGRMTCSWT